MLQVEEIEFIESARLVYDGVREVRRAVLLHRGEEESDTEEELELEHEELELEQEELELEQEVVSVSTPRCSSALDEYPEIQGKPTH